MLILRQSARFLRYITGSREPPRRAAPMTERKRARILSSLYASLDAARMHMETLRASGRPSHDPIFRAKLGQTVSIDVYQHQPCANVTFNMSLYMRFSCCAEIIAFKSAREEEKKTVYIDIRRTLSIRIPRKFAGVDDSDARGYLKGYCARRC